MNNITIHHSSEETCCHERKRACVITFGCQQNEADSEKIRGMAEELGYVNVDAPEGADLIVVNTCAIREHAEMKALSMVGRFKKMKKENPELIIGVVGCMAAEPHVAEMLKKDFHYVSFTLEPTRLHMFPELVRRYAEERRRSFVFGEETGSVVEGLPMVRSSSHKAWVSIMYGCNNFCSYCIVPYTRGRERSRCSAEILKECRELVNSGVKEITLLGQNVNSYKSDIDFSELILRIAEIEGDFIIRFMTSHPKDVSDRLIDVMSRYKGKIAPYFHLPLQSGSDKILRAMNRTYGREQFLDVVDKLRRAIPDISISSDIIVGFPGESEEDFQDTLDMLSRVEFDMVYAFLYSSRAGTLAAGMNNQVADTIKKERLARLLSLQDNISLYKNEKYVGRIERVLVDSVSDREGVLDARTYTNKLVHFNADTTAVGQFRTVKITKACAFDLYAEEIN